MRTAMFIVLLTLSSCKPGSPESYTMDAVRGPAGSMDFTVSPSGVMTLVPGVGEKLTRVDSVAATMAAVKVPVVASTTPVPIGTITLGKIAYELDGKSTCTRDFAMEVMPQCKNAPIADDKVLAQAATAVSVTQVAMPLADMACAAHGGYQTKIWQKQFKVFLAGSDKDLAAIKEVKYTVWRSYGKTFTGTSAADKFDSGSTFSTPVTSWDIDPAIVVLNDGKEYPIPKATLTWADVTPNKKAATPCE
jgi:hypothetical protein